MPEVIKRIAQKIQRPVGAYRNERKGAVAVEFALIAIIFVSIVSAIFESGRFFLTMNSFQAAVEDATRYALVHSPVSDDDLVQFIKGDMTAMLVSTDDIAVTISYTNSSGVDFIQVDGTFQFTTFMPFLPDSWDSIPINASSRHPVM